MNRKTPMTKTPVIAAALVLALAAGPAFAQHHAHAADAPSAKSDQPAKDTWITTKVKSELVTSDGVPSTEISVDTKNGVVWLSGDVQTEAERDRAVAKAKAVKGVKSVDASKLTVSGK